VTAGILLKITYYYFWGHRICIQAELLSTFCMINLFFSQHHHHTSPVALQQEVAGKNCVDPWYRIAQPQPQPFFTF